jgi:hypothetical protein
MFECKLLDDAAQSAHRMLHVCHTVHVFSAFDSMRPCQVKCTQTRWSQHT